VAARAGELYPRGGFVGKPIKVLIAGVAVLAVAAGAGWYLFLRSDAPPEVSLSGAVDSIASPTASSSESATPGASTAGPTATASAADGVNGAWTVATDQESFAGYRVQEELAQVGFTTAVGRTSRVEGTFLIVDGTLVSATVEADLSGLTSDKGMRDRALRDQALETSRFPTATFALGGPIELPEGLAAGEAATLNVAGDLTLHGVTKAIELPVEVQLQGEYLFVVGSLEIVFADYEIAQPRAQAVVSVEDHGVMEFQLILARSA